MGRRFVFVCALLCLAAGPAAAQLLYGSLVGNVKDASDAAIPDAVVKATQQGTGFSREARSNESGQFILPTLPGGTYDITVTKAGFSTFSAKSVTIAVNASTRLDAAMQVGTVSESVQVEAAPPQLQTDRGEVRAELTSAQLANAPLPPGRNYTQMFKTLPGFTSPRNGNGPSVDPSRAALYNVNGTSRSSNAVRIEGAGVNQIWLPHLPGYTPALESIENVNITTNSFDAETGLAGGAAINVQIKSGTNDIHGSLFEYHNSNATKAKPFFLPVPLDGFGERTVRQADACHVHARVDHPPEDRGVARGRADGGDDLGAAWHGDQCRRRGREPRASYPGFHLPVRQAVPRPRPGGGRSDRRARSPR